MAKKQPVPQDLPGMEDRKNRVLENVGREYAEIRDIRIDANRREAALKKKVKAEMARLEKTHYVSDNIEIDIEPPDGEEKVKVKLKKARVTKQKDGDDESSGDA